MPTKTLGIKLECTQRFDVRLVNIFIVLDLIGRSVITEKLHDMTPNEILLVQIQHISNIKISIRLYCSALMTFSYSFFVSPSIYGFIICLFVLWCLAPLSAIFYGASNLYFDKTSLKVTLPSGICYIGNFVKREFYLQKPRQVENGDSSMSNNKSVILTFSIH